MREYEYERNYRLEAGYWWFAGARKINRALLSRYFSRKTGKILDVGCGTGIMFSELEKFAPAVGTDKYREALFFCRKRGLTNLVRADGEALPFKSGVFDAVTAFGVIEHAERDSLFSREMLRVLAGGGRAFFWVPAFPFLYGEHDIASGHHRRYGKQQFRKLMEDCGFEVRKLSYVNFFLFPAIVAVSCLLRLVRRKTAEPSRFLFSVPAAVNFLLYCFLRAESLMIGFLDFPVGVSMVAVAERPQHDEKDLPDSQRG